MFTGRRDPTRGRVVVADVSFHYDNTFWGVGSAAVERCRLKANMDISLFKIASLK